MRSALLGLILGGCITPGQTPATPPESKPPTSVAAAHCAWPNGAVAAVSLTYDDALNSQLSAAVPALNARGLKATFFLSGGNIATFAPLAKLGHELASHTLHHPCNADLAALSPPEVAAELDAGLAAVRALGVTGKLTFAYPCGQKNAKGMESYVPLVQERFRAARGVAGVVADPEHVDLFNVPALFAPTSSDGSDVVAFIERAKETHGWAVIGVHGVGDAGEYLQLSSAAHEKVLSYLAEHHDVWTAPFGNVADALATCRQSAAGK